MKRSSASIIAICAAGLALCLDTVVAADLVEVRKADGTRAQHHGRIVEETYRSIKMEIEEGDATVEREFPLEEAGRQNVITVRHEQFPPGYSLAYQKFRNREYADAYEAFERAAEQLQDHPWLEPYVRFYAAEAAFREAKYARVEEQDKREWYARAEDQYRKLLERAPAHRFAPDATLRRAVALMRLDRFEEADRILAGVAASDFPSWIKREAEVWLGRLLVEQGRYDEGIEKLTTVVKRFSADPPPAIFSLSAERERRTDAPSIALISLGYAYQGKGDYPKAEEFFEAVGLRSPDDELRAEAYNSRGLSLLNRGQTREALFSFLRVVVLHYDIVHEYQRALYCAAKASKEYYGDDKRARELQRMLTNKFPNSYWAAKLKQEL